MKKIIMPHVTMVLIGELAGMGIHMKLMIE